MLGSRPLTSSFLRRSYRWGRPLLGLIVFGSCLWLLSRVFAPLHYQQLRRAVSSFAWDRLLLAALLTAANYVLFTVYDLLALRYVGTPLPYRRIALASFLSSAIGMNSGSLAPLTAGPVRFRLYASWGVVPAKIAVIIAFCTLSLWLGFAFLLCVSAALPTESTLLGIHLLPVSLVSGSFLAVYLGWCLSKRSFSLFGYRAESPGPAIGLSQMVVSTTDWLLASSVLLILLPDGLVPHPYSRFLLAFLLSQIAGLISQVPGGLGVFEAVFVLLSPAGADQQPALLGALLLFRAIYYLLPLVASLSILAAHEMLAWRKTLGAIGRRISALAPPSLAAATFAAGAVLLFSGATPGIAGRLQLVRLVLPLAVLEISHFLASIAGLVLLLLARGLWLRLEEAWLLTLGTLAAGSLLSLAKGLDYEEAILLGIVFLALLPARREFYRKGRLLRQPLSPQWLVGVGMVLAASVWLAAFSFHHVEFTSDVWWRFALDGDVPRTLRAAVGLLVCLLFGGIAMLLQPVCPSAELPGKEELDRVRAIIAEQPTTFGHLALLGDKALMFHHSERAFLMYGTRGRSWVSMGDPVGPLDAGSELIWDFCGMARRHGGLPALYEISPACLEASLDAGLWPAKVGEEARIDLTTFSMSGPRKKKLRWAHRAAEKEGCSFEILAPEQVSESMEALREISEAWLAHRHRRERGFSIGFFDEGYIASLPAALVDRGDQPIAFANIWRGAGREEISVDLMRFDPEKAARGIMDYLFVELILWAKREGFRWFNLGMAPLSGLRTGENAPLFNRVGTLLFRHGELFYNFRGIRTFKEKFDPQWTPRYIAFPNRGAMGRVSADIAALILARPRHSG